MSTELQIIVGTAITVHVYAIWSLLRMSARAEYAARKRRREFNQSLINRRSWNKRLP